MQKFLDFFSDTTNRVLFKVKGKNAFGSAGDIQNFEKLISISDIHNNGKVQLISLEYIKKSLGIKWFRSRDKILKSLRKKIKLKTGDEDVFFSRSDMEHLIVFENLLEHEAQKLCGDILTDITKEYLGVSYDHNILIRTAIGKRHGKLLFKDIAYSSKTIEELSEYESPAPRLSKTPKLEAFVSPIKPRKKRPFELIYKPIWDKKNNIVSTFMVSIRKNKGQKVDVKATTPIGYHALSNPFCLASMIELDRFMLDEIVEMMQDFFKNNFRAMFSIPLNYKTLFNLTRLHNFLFQCQAIPLPLRKYISFSLVDFPEGFPEARMHLIITSLLKYSREVTIVCDRIPADIKYYKGCGIKGICLNISEKDRETEEYLNKIQKLADDCAKEKINLSLDGIDDFDELENMKETELNFISGNTIGRYSDAPRHMTHMEWHDIVKH